MGYVRFFRGPNHPNLSCHQPLLPPSNQKTASQSTRICDRQLFRCCGGRRNHRLGIYLIVMGIFRCLCEMNKKYVCIHIYIYLFIEASIIYMKIHMFYIDHTFNILHLVHTKILNIIHYHSVILLHPLMTTRISTSGLKPSGTRTISTSNWWTGYHELLLDIHSFHILCIQETSWLPATKRGTGRLHCTKSFKRDDQLWCSKSLPQSEKGHPQKLMKPYASGKIFRNKLELTLCIFI